MTTHYTRRGDTVADELTGLGLGRLTPTAYDDLVAADASVDDAVARVVNGLAGEPDYPTLAAALVAGELTPSAAGKKLTGPTGARVQSLVDAVRTAAIADAERGEFAPAELRRSCVPLVAERLKRTADDMLASIAGLPSVAKAKLAEVVHGQYGPTYGPLTMNQLDGLLDVVAPGGLDRVRPDDLGAVQFATRSWSWWNEDARETFDAFYWLGTGRSSSVSWGGDRTGAGAAEAKAFHPGVLLLSGESVDLVSADVPLAFAVASGLIESFDVLADPFGTDAEAYRERVARAEQFREWKFAYRDTVTAGAAGLLGGPDERSRAALKRRAGLPALDAVRAFRDAL